MHSSTTTNLFYLSYKISNSTQVDLFRDSTAAKQGNHFYWLQQWLISTMAADNGRNEHTLLSMTLLQSIGLFRQLRHSVNKWQTLGKQTFVFQCKRSARSENLFSSFDANFAGFLSKWYTYCCAYDCYNNSTMKGLSWHGFPEDKKRKLIKVKMCYLIAQWCKTFVLRICNLISFRYRYGSRGLKWTRRKILSSLNTQNFVQTTSEKKIS